MKKEYILRNFCRYCGSSINLTIDHKHPKDLGGTENINNKQTLCRECNQLKSNIPHEVFVRIMLHGIACFLKKNKKKWI
jgi:5-methylcytosine-specific restriction endonuclease McrA